MALKIHYFTVAKQKETWESRSVLVFLAFHSEALQVDADPVSLNLQACIPSFDLCHIMGTEENPESELLWLKSQSTQSEL